MNGKIIELNNECGYILGENDKTYFFRKEDAYKEININDFVFFRHEEKKINNEYIAYKATNIIKKTTKNYFD